MILINEAEADMYKPIHNHPALYSAGRVFVASKADVNLPEYIWYHTLETLSC